MKPLQALLALFALAFLPLHAAGLNDLTYTTANGEVTITDCKILASETLVIPTTINGNSVTRIGDRAFQGCRSLTNIIIPDGVTSIGVYVFAYCSSLTSIMIPDSVTSIGTFAFQGCTSLTSITIPDSVSSIGAAAFYGCTDLTSVTIPDSVTSIGGGFFIGCRSLTSITIPDSVTSIGDSAFVQCTSLTSITIPDSVTSIGGSAFSECTSLTTIEVGAENVNYADVNGVLFNKEKTLLHTFPAGKAGANYVIPDSVISIGEGAFAQCTSLTSITIPDGVTSIGERAFKDCSSLTSITIPDGVTSIGDGAFRDCTSLTRMTIPDSVTSIGEGGFFGCASLTSITIGNGVTSIGAGAFRSCWRLRSVSFQGVAPTMGPVGVGEEVKAYVRYEFADSFGGFGNTWEGLTVAIQRATITDCGFVNATTFFIEFEPAGAGYRVMSSQTLNFSNAVEVTPTLQPTSGSDNRFEFTASGSRNFYQLEPTE